MDKRGLALELLPALWRKDAEACAFSEAEEIRLRLGRRPTLLTGGREIPFRDRSVTEEDLQRVLEKATGASMHTAAASLAEGYVSYQGLRVGVCGAAVWQENRACAFRRLSSLAVRIPRECRGICAEAADRLLHEGFRSTLILGPPGAGKTTALRELIRRLSENGLRLGVADERNELAALDAEGMAFDLGRCSDVLCGLPRARAAMMLLRSMNPQVLATDEISDEADALALRRVAGCGVGLLATVHASAPEELRQRAAFRQLLTDGVFSWCLRVRQERGARRYSLERLSE